MQRSHAHVCCAVCNLFCFPAGMFCPCGMRSYLCGVSMCTKTLMVLRAVPVPHRWGVAVRDGAGLALAIGDLRSAYIAFPTLPEVVRVAQIRLVAARRSGAAFYRARTILHVVLLSSGRPRSGGVTSTRRGSIRLSSQSSQKALTFRVRSGQDGALSAGVSGCVSLARLVRLRGRIWPCGRTGGRCGGSL